VPGEGFWGDPQRIVQVGDGEGGIFEGLQRLQVSGSFPQEKGRSYYLAKYEVSRGQFVAVMGSSGSGKSTCMNIIGCLDRPTAGRYLFAGIDVATLDRDQLALLRRHAIGFVFQGFNLLARTNALENVELPLVYQRLKRAQRRQRALEVLQLVGLGDRAGHAGGAAGDDALAPWHGLAVGLQEHAGGGAPRCGLPAVERGDPAGGRVVVHQECTAPDAGALGLDEAEHRLDRDRGIRGAAACAQDLEPGLDGIRVGRGHAGWIGGRGGRRRSRGGRLPDRGGLAGSQREDDAGRGDETQARRVVDHRGDPVDLTVMVL